LQAVEPAVEYSPGPHKTVGALSLSGHIKPAGHIVHAICPTKLYWPAGQSMPTLVLSAQYFPASQRVQYVEPAKEYSPSRQSIGPKEVTGQYFPAGQIVQDSLANPE